MTTPDTRAEVERLLAEHAWHHTATQHCRCGFRTSLAQLAVDGYHAHVASVLAAAGLLADTRPDEPAQGDREAMCVCHGPGRPHAPHQPCDMGCQPDWHRDGCAIYLPRTAPQPHADTVETVEWRRRCEHGAGMTHGSRDAVADPGPNCTDAWVERRTRVTTPDVVGPWEVVS